jgi:hypothetical protein
MSNPDRETLRQALTAALNQLEAGGAGQSQLIITGNEPVASSISNAQTPIVLVYLGGAQANQAPTSALEQKCESKEHPSLGKFGFLELPAVSSAPKSCFIEPERTCVNSGACEALGY